MKLFFNWSYVELYNFVMKYWFYVVFKEIEIFLFFAGIKDIL